MYIYIHMYIYIYIFIIIIHICLYVYVHMLIKAAPGDSLGSRRCLGLFRTESRGAADVRGLGGRSCSFEFV